MSFNIWKYLLPAKGNTKENLFYEMKNQIKSRNQSKISLILDIPEEANTAVIITSAVH